MCALAGMEFDPTGVYHAGARYYNPELQRFIS
jgi:RHS repeat-associated protein